MKKINGQPVPENLPLSQLKTLLESSDMQKFAAACEALRAANTMQAYEVLKSHISSPDPYKRRCVLAVIFDYPEASELVFHLEQALQSEKLFLVGTALDVIIAGRARVSDEVVLACMERNLKTLGRYACYALDTVEKTQTNLLQIRKMYHSSLDNSIRIALAECLHGFRNEENHMVLFQMFQDDPIPQIRILACRIAKEYRQADLLQRFVQDRDGHIRKLALPE